MNRLAAYASPRWLPGGHLQTIWAATFAATRPAPHYIRERWTTPDDDFIDLDWLNTSEDSHETPLLVLWHGLEGSSKSRYAVELMHAVAAHGWNGVVVHFRGCSGELNLQPRAYHSGDSDEIDWVVRRLRDRCGPQRPIFLAGVSLGGNALAKWLGETHRSSASLVAAAAVISAPLDLVASAMQLNRGFALIYTRHFLASLIPKALAQLKRHPGLFDAAAVRRARNFEDFDSLVTAPIHGFRDCYDYWERASAKPGLTHIRVPTLIINAHNDPFIPPASLPRAHEVSPWVSLEQPEHGGHVGFPQGRFPTRLNWLPNRLLSFFSRFEAGVSDDNRSERALANAVSKPRALA